MAGKAWCRLWLPLGNALLLMAILETVDMVRSELQEVGVFIYEGLNLHFEGLSDFYQDVPEILFFTISIGIRLFATIALLWIGAIFMGNKNCLLAWIVTTVILWIAVTIFLIHNTISASHKIDGIHMWSIAYSMIMYGIFNTFVLYIAIVSYQAMGRQETLHPIGKGVRFVWEYFSNETKTAATFFLTTEIALDANYLVCRQFQMLFGIGVPGHVDYFPPIVVEEIIMRIIRIVTNAIGLYLLSKENRRAFRWWCAFTFALIVASSTIFVILTVMWRGEDASTLAYLLMFPGHLMFRFITLYFCLKYTRADFSNFVL